MDLPLGKRERSTGLVSVLIGNFLVRTDEVVAGERTLCKLFLEGTRRFVFGEGGAVCATRLVLREKKRRGGLEVRAEEGIKLDWKEMSVSEDLAAETKKRAFLAPPPKSGELTPAGRKVIGEMFVFLGSIIVFSTTINYNECGGLCFSSLEGCSKVCDTYESSCSSLRTSYQVISGIVWIVMLIVMSLNLLVLLKKVIHTIHAFVGTN